MTFNNWRLFHNLLRYSEKKFLKLASQVSRENARTPVQWKNAENAGFTTGTPWFNVNKNYDTINVEDADKDPNSLLNFYRKLIHYRKGNELVIYGKYNELYKKSKDLYVYERVLDGERLLVVCSFTENGVRFTAPEGYDLSKGELVISNYDTTPIFDNSFITRPYEVRVYHFAK